MTTYDEIFALFTANQLKAVGEEFNLATGGNEGTTDDKKHGTYKTGLPFPQLEDDSKINWAAYFDERNNIGPEFCVNIIYGGNLYSSQKAKYETYCSVVDPVKNAYAYNFNLVFPSAIDKTFKEWVFDAFAPVVKKQTFKTLATLFPFGTPEIFETMIADNYPGAANKEIRDLFMKMYSSR